jgi:hypothetical protein
VDIIDWQYQDTMGLKNAKFITQSITEWDKLDDDSINVFAFPKCIGEFPDDVFDKVCEIFKNTTFKANRIIGICSLMEKGKNADAARFKKIAGIMLAHGFRCLDDLDSYFTAQAPDKGLRKICPEFVYPDVIKSRVEALLDECPKYVQQKHSCKADCHELKRSPILKATFVNYQSLRFERP